MHGGTGFEWTCNDDFGGPKKVSHNSPESVADTTEPSLPAECAQGRQLRVDYSQVDLALLTELCTAFGCQLQDGGMVMMLCAERG